MSPEDSDSDGAKAKNQKGKKRPTSSGGSKQEQKWEEQSQLGKADGKADFKKKLMLFKADCLRDETFLQTFLLEMKEDKKKKPVEASIADLQKALKLVDTALGTLKKEDVKKALLCSLAALKEGKAIKREASGTAKAKKQKKAPKSEEEEESD